jgi:hypothetical protein
MELRNKLNNPEYIALAIESIANGLSKHIIEEKYNVGAGNNTVDALVSISGCKSLHPNNKRGNCGSKEEL